MVTATGGEIAVTHLDEVYRWAGHTRACTFEQGHATKRTWEKRFPISGVGAPIEEGIQLGLDTKNPMLPQIVTPAINAEVGIFFGADGTGSNGLGFADGIYLHYVTDLFPSYGIQVESNGTTVGTWVVNDASCITLVLGFRGAFNLGRGLTKHSNTGFITVGPPGGVSGASYYLHATADPGDSTLLDIPPSPPDFVQKVDFGPNDAAPDGLCTGKSYSAFPGSQAGY